MPPARPMWEMKSCLAKTFWPLCLCESRMRKLEPRALWSNQFRIEQFIESNYFWESLWFIVDVRACFFIDNIYTRLSAHIYAQSSLFIYFIVWIFKTGFYIYSKCREWFAFYAGNNWAWRKALMRAVHWWSVTIIVLISFYNKN